MEVSLLINATTTTITIRIDEIEKQLLQEFAEDHDLTLSQVVRRALKEYLQNHEGD